MGRDTVHTMLARLNADRPREAGTATMPANAMPSMQAARWMLKQLSRPTGDSFLFLVDQSNAFEMRAGDALPSRLWHDCPKRRRWVSIPAPDTIDAEGNLVPDVDALALYFEALEQWIAPESEPDRLSEATRTAEARLAEQSRLQVIPAEQVPALIKVGRPLLTELLHALTPDPAAPTEGTSTNESTDAT